MSEYIYLQGSENVKSTGHAMERAAQLMSEAAGQIEWSLQQHAQREDQRLSEWRELLAAQSPPATEVGT